MGQGIHRQPTPLGDLQHQRHHLADASLTLRRGHIEVQRAFLESWHGHEHLVASRLQIQGQVPLAVSLPGRVRSIMHGNQMDARVRDPRSRRIVHADCHRPGRRLLRPNSTRSKQRGSQQSDARHL